MTGLRRVVALGAAIAVAIAIASAPAQAADVHDFDAPTLAAYISLRFSSGVPPSVIRTVLAGEGFSQRNLDLITADGSTVGSHSAITRS